MTTIKLNTINARFLLRATLAAVSKDVTRESLCGIHLMVRDGFVVATATDGHRLHRASVQWVAFEVEGGELPPTGALLIPLKGAEAALKAVPAPKRGQAPALATFTATGFETDSASVKWTSLDARAFPDADRVIAGTGNAEKPAPTLGVSPRYVVDAAEACALLDPTIAMIWHQPSTVFDPVRVEATGYPNAEKATVLAVIMPVRL
jgi:hypothetical protein